jgi:hypothetical protein
MLEGITPGMEGVFNRSTGRYEFPTPENLYWVEPSIVVRNPQYFKPIGISDVRVGIINSAIAYARQYYRYFQRLLIADPLKMFKGE